MSTSKSREIIPKRVKDLTGQVFARLTVMEFAGLNFKRKALWSCACECGTIKTVTSVHLMTGDAKSCGCLHREQLAKGPCYRHGHCASKELGTHYSREYQVWRDMKGRCSLRSNKKYHLYGGRGIRVCDRWQDSFENFLADMGHRPSSKHSIDRFPDMNGNYEPSNCRWATRKQQSRNKRNTRLITHDGKTLCLADWAAIVGIGPVSLAK